MTDPSVNYRVKSSLSLVKHFFTQFQPVAIIKETADKLTGTNLSSNAVIEEHPVEEKKKASCS